MADKPEIDEVSGTETTGHEWDGLRELNTPLPRWWLYIFYATIIWSVGYWIAFPAWPLVTGYTQGLLDYSARAEVQQAVEAGKEAQSIYRDKIDSMEVAAILEDEELVRFSMAGGSASFGTNCSGCHGSGAQGFVGYPNLLDDAWLWGGTVDDIHTTLLYGIRSGHDEARVNDMPAFGADELLERADIEKVTDFVLALGGGYEAAATAHADGAVVFEENCAACHGDDAKGITEMGAPNLTDVIWLYGGERADILNSINNGRAGVMPAWHGRLDPVTIKTLAVYVHSLGGGQ